VYGLFSGNMHRFVFLFDTRFDAWARRSARWIVV
jgi:hypothetical protein